MLGRPQDILTFLQPMRPALLLTFMNLAGVFLGGYGKKFMGAFSISETKAYLLLYVIMILGIPFAYHRGLAFEGVFLKYLPNILFFLFLVSEVDSLERLKSLILVICLSAFILSFFGYLYGTSFEGRFGIHNSIFDPNDIAYILVSLCPFSLYYLQSNQKIWSRAFGIIVLGSSIILILLTGSRGGLLGLATIFFLIMTTKMGSMKQSHKIVVLCFLASVYFLFGDKINVERFFTLMEIGSDYNVNEESGRLRIWEHGIQMLINNPVTGVGFNCFPMALGYLRESLGLIPSWQVAHNSYIQISAELGLFGFIVFCIIIIQSFATFLRASGIEAACEKTSEIKLLGGLMFVSFAGHFVSAIFLTQGYSVLFTLFFGLAAIIRQIQNEFTLSKDNKSKISIKKTIRQNLDQRFRRN